MRKGERVCTCGSGKASWWEHDARGIPLTRVCPNCKTDRMMRYRTAVLINPSYEADEQIEED
jgi:hypothetical protein